MQLSWEDNRIITAWSNVDTKECILKIGFGSGRLAKRGGFFGCGLICKGCFSLSLLIKEGENEEKCMFLWWNLTEKCRNNVVQKDKDVYRAAFEVRWGQDSSYWESKTDWQVFLLDNLMADSDYHIAAAVVLSNDREIKTKGECSLSSYISSDVFGEYNTRKRRFVLLFRVLYFLIWCLGVSFCRLLF